jgi:hypothetical protein
MCQNKTTFAARRMTEEELERVKAFVDRFENGAEVFSGQWTGSALVAEAKRYRLLLNHILFLEAELAQLRQRQHNKQPDLTSEVRCNIETGTGLVQSPTTDQDQDDDNGKERWRLTEPTCDKCDKAPAVLCAQHPVIPWAHYFCESCSNQHTPSDWKITYFDLTRD